jgi:hypothetical protein
MMSSSSGTFYIIAKVALALTMLVAIAGFPSAPIQPRESIRLVLGGGGKNSWDIGNIKPGDSGNKTVELYNDSDSDGDIIIWISDTISGEGMNPESETGDTAGPGELGDYLLFNGSCSHLDTNLSLPVTIYALPQSASGPHYMKIVPFHARETIVLTWEWEFPKSSQPQNNAQGDSLSFTINYLLEA